MELADVNMITPIEAVYEQGILRPLKPLELAEGTMVAIVLLEPDAARPGVLSEAMSDPLFVADLDEIAEDFKYADADLEDSE